MKTVIKLVETLLEAEKKAYEETSDWSPDREMLSAGIECYENVLSLLTKNFDVDPTDTSAPHLARVSSATFQVAEVISDVWANNPNVTWKTFDNLPKKVIVDKVMMCMMAGLFEDAMIGLTYLIYQRKITPTNFADELIENPASVLDK